jgi:hypothetical protein
MAIGREGGMQGKIKARSDRSQKTPYLEEVGEVSHPIFKRGEDGKNVQLTPNIHYSSSKLFHNLIKIMLRDIKPTDNLMQCYVEKPCSNTSICLLSALDYTKG